MKPYLLLQSFWEGAPDIQAILSSGRRYIYVSGENEIHARGFFPDLVSVAAFFGDECCWLLSLDGDEHCLELACSGTEDEYFSKLTGAPEWAPGIPFPYAVRHQCFIGNGKWILLSDRDDERMHLIVRDAVAADFISHALALVRR